ncbi:Arabinose 5-phosphate isomerase GutQ [Escovopsis weberi]|uniref:Arabinose 5-phosphate isomerase GutQ n=1 Tax=Escovopsis weberi TaxID=150374 RepID=A0A0M8N5C7_ESCWE|nr:Arabinose 5-phosphate isomerase GutQ [Escovopsis weberi]
MEQLAQERRLMSGIHVLKTESAALTNLTRLYEVDDVARRGFDDAVKAITRQASNKGKLVIVGVGKSGHIGKKLVATFQSLGIRAVFLHPTEALHGDLGIVSSNDTLLFVTYSGKTQELLLLLPHLEEALPTILLTSHMRHETCEFMKHRPNTILLPAPIPESETVSFGVAAPSSSTTVALALGDALALTAANDLHASVAAAFAKNHPGGAIGADTVAASGGTLALGQISTPLDSIPETEGLNDDCLGLGLLRAGFNSNTGWVRVGDEIASPTKIRNLSDGDLGRPIRELAGVLVPRQHMIAMSSETTIRQARDILHNMRSSSVQEQDPVPCGDSIIAVTKGGYITSVVEVEQVLNHHEGEAR